MSSTQDTSKVYRLASLYNGVAFEQLHALCWDGLVDYTYRNDGILEIAAQRCRRPVQETPIFGPQVPDNVRRTFVSVNKCVAVVVYNTGWLTYCIQDLDIEVEEMTLTAPKRGHNVEWSYLPGPERLETSWHHTFLLLTPRSGGNQIVADATYAQYSFHRGIDTFDEYVKEKVDEGGLMHQFDFGYEFDRHMENDELDPFVSGQMKSIIHITNNVVMRELASVGGIDALLSMCQESFDEAHHKIIAAVHEEMYKLRLRLERIRYGPDTEYLAQLKSLEEEYDGAGHQSCMQSLQRAVERQGVEDECA